MILVFCLFVCSGFFVTLENFSLTITSEGLQILTYSAHMASEGSLACHTFCNTGHPFIMVISEDPWTHTYCQAFASAAVTTCFYDLCLSRLGFELPTFRLRGERSNRLRYGRGHDVNDVVFCRGIIRIILPCKRYCKI